MLTPAKLTARIQCVENAGADSAVNVLGVLKFVDNGVITLSIDIHAVMKRRRGCV